MTPTSADLQELEAETKPVLYSRLLGSLSVPGSWGDPGCPTETDLRELDELLSLGLSACTSILREYIKQLPHNTDEGTAEILYGLHWGYGNIRAELRKTWMALNFECYRIYMEKTDWHPWDGQFNPLGEATPDQALTDYDRDFIQACLNAFCVRGNFQGFHSLVTGRIPQVIDLIAKNYPRTVALYLYDCWGKSDFDDNSGELGWLEDEERQLIVEAYESLKRLSPQEDA